MNDIRSSAFSMPIFSVHAALYERLSRDDELQGESNSIVNQKLLLENYATQNGFTQFTHYTDDGYSGGNFDRPAWKQMIADIEAGKIKCVIVKDMSRVGREYLQTGFYTEILFREQGVRFIAITNGVDSNDKNSSEFAPFLNIMNEWYLRDCSRKQCAAYQARGNSGKRTSNHAIYGYKKDPLNKHHLIIDEESAAVVRRIFRMAIEGHGTRSLAYELTKAQIERPSCYNEREGRRNHQANADPALRYTWSEGTVARILARQEYLGHTVNFRSHKESYKDKSAVQLPPEKWEVIKNTHEPIIDVETWTLAQKLRRTVRRTDTTGEANPLTGLLYCADCGKRLYNHRARYKSVCDEQGVEVKRLVTSADHYRCPTHDAGRAQFRELCTPHYISTSATRTVILETLRAVSRHALQDEKAFIDAMREASKIREEATLKEQQRQIAKHKRRSGELDGLIKKLYEAYATDKLEGHRFELLVADYEREQKTLLQIIAQAELEVAAFQSDTDRAEKFLALAKKYTDFTELTTPMINEFVDKIIVHAPDRSTGERIQEVEIFLKFVGKLELPQEEMSPKQAADVEKKIRYNERQRAYYHKRKAQNTKQQEGA